MKLALIKGPMNRTATILGFFSSLLVEKFTGKDLYEMLRYLQDCDPEAVNSSQIIDNLKWGWGELEYYYLSCSLVCTGKGRKRATRSKEIWLTLLSTEEDGEEVG